MGGVLNPLEASTSAIWSGDSGGYHWAWSSNNVTATRPGARTPSLSLRALLKDEPDPTVQTSRSRKVTVLSVVGPLVSVRVEDEWDGGAHPSGETWYQTFDARHPERDVTLTDYFPYAGLRKALFADRFVGGILRKKGRKEAPATSDQLEAELSGEVFGSGDFPYQFGDHALSQFSFHHLEGERVAIRLNVSWWTEPFRFHTTEIGFLAAAPAELKSWLASASAGTAGFLTRTAAGKYRGKTATLLDWSKPRR